MAVIHTSLDKVKTVAGFGLGALCLLSLCIQLLRR